MAEVLIVDDERVLRDGLKALLVGEGYAVRTARDGTEALKRLAEQCPDLILLDVMMPKMNGFRTCEEIRRLDRLVPVIFLTAKDSEADQVRGIGLGADDYVSKDAGESVLLARIRRAIARTEEYDRSSSVLQLGRVKVNLDALLVEEGADTRSLTRTEAGILRLLASDGGRYFAKDEIVAALRGSGYACEDGMVYVHVYNLRQKLGAAAALLQNDRLSGYRLMV